MFIVFFSKKIDLKNSTWFNSSKSLVVWYLAGHNDTFNRPYVGPVSMLGSQLTTALCDSAELPLYLQVCDLFKPARALGNAYLPL